MPRFSVIIPAYQVQAYLRECLESVLSQDYADFEIVAVDDHSPDGSGAILDEFAARDRRITVLHLPENVGLGRARNAGMARATGDYLVFLDSDDTLAPGSLRALADRLATTGDPDVLIYDYDRTYWTGEAYRNQLADLLEQRDPQVFTLRDRPELLRLLMIACNKAYRRGFIDDLGLTFPPGYYEDTPWSYPVLLAAGSIAVLDRVCLHYRQRRRGNILGTTSRRHFDIFDQYDRVFAFIDARPELAEWRPVLFQRMLDHLGTVYSTPGRVPRSARAEFFRRCREQYRRYQPPGGSAARGRQGVRYRLLGLGARRTFQLLRNAERVRRAGADGGSMAFRKLRAGAMQVHYRLQLRRGIDPDLAVFAAYWNRGYSCNPAAIEAKVRELAPHIRTAWVTTPEFAHTLPPGVQRLHPGSARFWTALARAKYLVNNVNFTHQMVKRRGQIHLQTNHGTPLKHMGVDLVEHPAAMVGVDLERLMSHVDRWDYSLAANPHTTMAWQRAYPADYTILEYGYPRNDVFYRATAADVERLRASLGIAPGTTAVLYAPTHRDYRRSEVALLDVDRLAQALGPGFTLLIRSHYFYTPAPAAGAGAGGAAVVDVSGYPSVEELSLASDALLTDYSSLMFDYANLDRPIVILAEDWEVYQASRGTYFDITEEPPGAVARDQQELARIFTTGAWRNTEAAERRAAFRARFCTFDDGHAAERVVRHLFLGEQPAEGEPAPPIVPLARRRPAPAPGTADAGTAASGPPPQSAAAAEAPAGPRAEAAPAARAAQDAASR